MTAGSGGQDKPLSSEEREPHLIVLLGDQRTIVYANTGTKTDPEERAKDFYEGLPLSDQAKFDNIFSHLCEHGQFNNDEKYHKSIGDYSFQDNGRRRTVDIAEFKVHTGKGQRIWGVREGRTLVLTHGAQKPKKTQLKAEINRAGEIYRQDVYRRETEREKG